jgi:hypothetical protein
MERSGGKGLMDLGEVVPHGLGFMRASATSVITLFEGISALGPLFRNRKRRADFGAATGM